MSILQVYKRTKCGKSFNRRLRSNNKFPAIIYGCNKPTLLIAIDNDIFMNKQIKKNFYTEELLLLLEGKKINVKIQSIQRHPYKLKLYHIDFIFA